VAYKGRVIHIPLGSQGLNQSPNPAQIPPAGLLEAKGLTFADDTLRKAPGVTQIATYDGGVTTYPLAAWEFAPTDGKSYIYSLGASGVVYRCDSDSPAQVNTTTLTTLSPVPSKGVFVECGNEASTRTDPVKDRMIMLFTGECTPVGFRGDAGTVQAVTVTGDWNSASNMPLGGVIHNGGLWAYGNANRPHYLYRSRLSDHADFATTTTPTMDAIFQSVYPGVGQRIYVAKSYKGMLFILKYPRGLFWLDDTDVNPAGWRVQQITDSIGCAPSPQAAIQLDDGILFVSADGNLYALLANTQGGIEVVNYGEKLGLDSWLRENLHLGQLDKIRGVWNTTTKEAIFSSYAKNGLSWGLTIVNDFSAMGKEGGVPRVSYDTKDAATCLGVRRNPVSYQFETFYGTSGAPGTLRVIGKADRTNVSSAYTGLFQTSHSNLGEYLSDAADADKIKSMMKIFDFLEIEYIPTSQGTLTIRTWVDGTLTDTISVTLQPSGPKIAYSSGTDFVIYLGSGTTAASLLGGSTASGPAPLSVQHVRLTGTGRRISFEFSNATASEDFNITGIYLGFREAGQDLRS